MFELFRNDFASWDDLSSLYRNGPYLNLDTDVLSQAVFENCLPVLPEFDITEETTCSIELPEETGHTPDHSTSSSAGNSIREKLKHLNDLSYLCQGASVLQEQSEVLSGVLKSLKASVPTEGGLPLHQGQTAARPLCQLPM